MNILSSGFDLMLYGMGTVFVFLVLLIFTTTLMSKIIGQFFPQDTGPALSPAKSDTQLSQIDGDLLKVLQAAVDARRNSK